jgi:hypothetical protein
LAEILLYGQNIHFNFCNNTAKESFVLYICNINAIAKLFHKPFNKTMKRSLIPLTYLMISLLLFISSCKKDSVDSIEENELVTSVKLNFSSGGTTQTFKFADPDGDGGAAPIVETINLKANTDYTLTIEILDESKTPISNITDEVATEKDEHLFIYTPSPSSLLTYTYGDKDSRNFNVGLTGNVKTGAAATGKLKVQLRHQPPINGKPSKDGTTTPGSDDVNIDFNISIQ